MMIYEIEKSKQTDACICKFSRSSRVMWSAARKLNLVGVPQSPIPRPSPPGANESKLLKLDFKDRAICGREL